MYDVIIFSMECTHANIQTYIDTYIATMNIPCIHIFTDTRDAHGEFSGKDSRPDPDDRGGGGGGGSDRLVFL